MQPRTRIIPLDTYPRREHLEHFLTMSDPFLTVTVQQDVTELVRRIRERGLPMFLTTLYVITRAANTVPELRRRLCDEGIREYEVCGASYTVACADETYRYCNVDCTLPFSEYLTSASAAQARAEAEEHLTETGDPESYFYISCMPWFGYSSLELPKPGPRFSVPCISWGRLEERTEAVPTPDGIAWKRRVLLPLTIMVNHALVDGLQLARFLEALSEELERPENEG